MNIDLPKKFEYYLNKGVIRQCSPDKSRAQFLIDESKNSFEGLQERIKKMDINEKNANSIIKDCYDILMELIRAKLLLDGYVSSGQYAHEAEVAYLKNIGFFDNDILIINELRYFRNRAMYYGKILNDEYANKVVKFTNMIFPKLNIILEKTI